MLTPGSFVQWKTKSAIAVGFIKQIIKDGSKVRNIAVDMIGTPESPIALIEVWRKSGDKYQPSGVLVGHPVSILQKADQIGQMLETGESVMTAFYLPPILAKELAQPNGEPPESLHLTLGYFGKLELSEEDLIAIDRALTEFASEMPPIVGKVSGVGRFNASPSSNNLDVIYASFDSPMLPMCRHEMMESLKAVGLECDMTHGYVPHITLAYVEPGSGELPSIPTIDIVFNELVLEVGDRRYSFPLTQPDTDKVKKKRKTPSKKDLIRMPEVEGEIQLETLVTDAQLQKINAVAGAAVGMKPIRAEEVAIASFVMADNLVNRSLGKWIKKDLGILINLAIGLPFTLDHDWDSVEKSQGVIFDGRLVQKDGDRRYLDRAGNYKLNQDVVAGEGHWQAIVDVAFPIYSHAIPALRFGQAGAVSAGGFAYKDYWCPLCNTSFNDESCPHGIPEPQWGLTHEQDKRIAPYYIRKDVYDLGEVSLVLIGNLPNAGIVKT